MCSMFRICFVPLLTAEFHLIWKPSPSALMKIHGPTTSKTKPDRYPGMESSSLPKVSVGIPFSAGFLKIHFSVKKGFILTCNLTIRQSVDVVLDRKYDCQVARPVRAGLFDGDLKCSVSLVLDQNDRTGNAIQREERSVKVPQIVSRERA